MKQSKDLIEKAKEAKSVKELMSLIKEIAEAKACFDWFHLSEIPDDELCKVSSGTLDSGEKRSFRRWMCKPRIFSDAPVLAKNAHIAL